MEAASEEGLSRYVVTSRVSRVIGTSVSRIPKQSERAILLSFAGEKNSFRRRAAVAVLFLDTRGGCHPRSRDRRYKQKSVTAARLAVFFFSVRFVTRDDDRSRGTFLSTLTCSGAFVTLRSFEHRKLRRLRSATVSPSH